MTLRQAIYNKKKQLINKAKKTGIYENFGQSQVRELRDRYIDISSYTDEMNKNRELLFNFSNWCMTFSL